MTGAVCKKCKQPCDETCTACKKGYILHYRCMKPGDRLLVRLRRFRTSGPETHMEYIALLLVGTVTGLVTLCPLANWLLPGIGGWAAAAFVVLLTDGLYIINVEHFAEKRP